MFAVIKSTRPTVLPNVHKNGKTIGYLTLREGKVVVYFWGNSLIDFSSDELLELSKLVAGCDPNDIQKILAK